MSKPNLIRLNVLPMVATVLRNIHKNFDLFLVNIGFTLFFNQLSINFVMNIIHFDDSDLAK